MERVQNKVSQRAEQQQPGVVVVLGEGSDRLETENSPVNFALTGIASQCEAATDAAKCSAEVISNTGNLYWRSVGSL